MVVKFDRQAIGEDGIKGGAIVHKRSRSAPRDVPLQCGGSAKQHPLLTSFLGKRTGVGPEKRGFCFLFMLGHT